MYALHMPSKYSCTLFRLYRK